MERFSHFDGIINLKLTTKILITGTNFEKFAQIKDFLKIKMEEKKIFYKIVMCV